METGPGNESIVNATTTDFHIHTVYPLWYQILATTIFAICCIVGIVGNMLVIYVVVRVKGMASLTNMYLVSLACADLLVLIGGNLTQIPGIFLYRSQWIFGSFMCSTCVFMQYLGINASALSITAFTIERYIGICHPFRAQVWSTVQRVKCIIASLWAFSILYNAAWLYLAVTKRDDDNDGVAISICAHRINRKMYATIYLADLITFYAIPLLLIIVLYSRIGVALRASTRAVQDPSILYKKKKLESKTVLEKLVLDPAVNKEYYKERCVTEKSNQAYENTVKQMEHARCQVSE